MVVLYNYQVSLNSPFTIHHSSFLYGAHWVKFGFGKTQFTVSNAKALQDITPVTFQLLRSWLKVLALKNMASMSVTWVTFQLLRSWLKA